jgi:hypothetical protein
VTPAALHELIARVAAHQRSAPTGGSVAEAS